MTETLTEQEIVIIGAYCRQILKTLRDEGASEKIVSMTFLGFTSGIRAMKPDMDDEEVDSIMLIFDKHIKLTALSSAVKERMQ